MAFIANKKMGYEREDKLVELYNLKVPFGSPAASWGAFDEERDAILFPIGGRGDHFDEIPRYSVLIWKKNIIKIEDYESRPDVTKNETVGSWKITRIEIPKCLKSNSNEIVEIIKEAFITRDKELLPLRKKEYQFEYVASPDFY